MFRTTVKCSSQLASGGCLAHFCRTVFEAFGSMVIWNQTAMVLLVCGSHSGVQLGQIGEVEEIGEHPDRDLSAVGAVVVIDELVAATCPRDSAGDGFPPGCMVERRSEVVGVCMGHGIDFTEQVADTAAGGDLDLLYATENVRLETPVEGVQVGDFGEGCASDELAQSPSLATRVGSTVRVPIAAEPVVPDRRELVFCRMGSATSIPRLRSSAICASSDSHDLGGRLMTPTLPIEIRPAPRNPGAGRTIASSLARLGSVRQSERHLGLQQGKHVLSRRVGRGRPEVRAALTVPRAVNTPI